MSSNDVAVVTGAARGIGLAVAEKLAERGYQVLMTDLDAAAVQASANRIGRGAWSIEQDVRDLAGHRRVAAEAASRGPLRVWVNNAGILFTGAAWTQTDEQVAAIIDVNVRGVFAGSRAAVETMRAGGGTILNLASISALTPVPGLAMYAATKAAVLSYTTSLQGDLDHAGLAIKVKALCPDVVGTEMVTRVERDPGAAILFAGPKPLDEHAVAEAAMALLASPQIFRVLPRWRGALVRSGDLFPSIGLKVLGAMRGAGEKVQARQREATRG